MTGCGNAWCTVKHRATKGWYSVSPSPGFDRVSSWLTPEETRVLGRALIATANAAEQMHDLEVALKDAHDLTA